MITKKSYEIKTESPNSREFSGVRKTLVLDPDVAHELEQFEKTNRVSFTFLVNQACRQWIQNPVVIALTPINRKKG